MQLSLSYQSPPRAVHRSSRVVKTQRNAVLQYQRLPSRKMQRRMSAAVSPACCRQHRRPLAFRQSPSSIRRRCASTHAGGRCTRYHTCTSAEVAQQGREPEEPFPHPCCCSLPRCALKSPIGVCIGDDRQRRACHVRLACRSSRVSQCVLLGRFHMARLCSLLSGTAVQSSGKRVLLCVYHVNIAILRYCNSQPLDYITCGLCIFGSYYDYHYAFAGSDRHPTIS